MGIGNTLEDLQRFFTDVPYNKKGIIEEKHVFHYHTIGLVTDDDLEALQHLPKEELVKKVHNVIHQVLEELKVADQHHPSSMDLARSLEIFLDNDNDMLTEIQVDNEATTRVFVFSDAFKARIDKLLGNQQQQNKRQPKLLDMMKFMSKMAEMK